MWLSAVRLSEASVISGRVVPLIPGETLIAGALCSRVCHTAEKIDAVLQQVSAGFWEQEFLDAGRRAWLP